MELRSQWNQYEAIWEEHPGRMQVNMDIHRIAPLPDRPYLLEYSKQLIDCDDNGFPEYQNDAQIEIDVSKLIQQLEQSRLVVHAGRFYYQCIAKDYIYVSDTTGIGEIVGSEFGLRSNSKIVQDPDWNIYFDFIYPDAYLKQTMNNRLVIDALLLEEFDFSKKHLLTHFAAFSDQYDRRKYRTFLLELNFKILEESESIEVGDEGNDPSFMIKFTRKDKVNLERLSNITLRLDTRAHSLSGAYLGWQIELD